MTKLLFICSRNKKRSLTAEKIFAKNTDFQVRSAGTSPSARRQVSSKDISWSTHIFTMETKHTKMLQQKFGDQLLDKQITCLNIPDEFEYMDEELICLLETSLELFK